MAQRLYIAVGTRFGRLTITGELASRKSKSGSVSRMFSCTCDCGNKLTVALRHLRNGHTQSCGCYRAEVTGVRSTTHGHTAGRDQSIYYDLWCTIKSKVVSRSHADAVDYQHVSLYTLWSLDFSAFHNYLISVLGPRPTGYSLDRINTLGNYEPGNLRWATPLQQAQNTRRNRYLTFNGETKCLSQWARDIGVSRGTLDVRLTKLGWTVERAFTVPPRSMRKSKAANQGEQDFPPVTFTSRRIP